MNSRMMSSHSRRYGTFIRPSSSARAKAVWHGLAAYDAAIALFVEGAYQEAQTAFHHLLTARHGLHGFDRRTCALFLRHAGACAGYHAERGAEIDISDTANISYLRENKITKELVFVQWGRNRMFPHTHIMYTAEELFLPSVTIEDSIKNWLKLTNISI